MRKGLYANIHAKRKVRREHQLRHNLEEQLKRLEKKNNAAARFKT